MGLEQFGDERDLASLAVALVPLASYLLWIGLLHWRTRATVLSGTRDVLLMALGLLGVFAVGPMELFMPEAAASRFGVYIWLQLLALYWLSIALLVLLARPRIVVYNVEGEQLRAIVVAAAQQLGAEAQWVGNSLVLLTLGVTLHLDETGLLRHAQLVASGPRQSLEGWYRLRQALVQQLAGTRVPRNRRAAGLISVALLLLVLVGILVVQDPRAIAEGLRDKLRW